MFDSQSAARSLRRLACFAAAAVALLAISPAAKAQGLFSFFGGGPSPYEIERRLDAAGYRLTGPLVRRGDIYLADVALGRGDFERLVIDAETGTIVQRFRAGPARWREVGPHDWDQAESESWGSPPRPPVGFDRPPQSAPLSLPGAGQAPRASTHDQVARGDEAPKPSDVNEKPKPKPREVKRKTIAPESVAKAPAPAANPPASAQAAESAAAPPAPIIAPTPAAANEAPAASPSPPPAAKAEGAPAPDAPPAAPPAVKADASSSVAVAKSPPPAEAPDAHAPGKSKAVNDLPATPLD